jgi:hypothetical protein
LGCNRGVDSVVDCAARHSKGVHLMEAIIEINGRKYECIVEVEKGERAARENGQKLWPDTPDHVVGLEAIAYTPRGTCRVTSARILNKLYERVEL